MSDELGEGPRGPAGRFLRYGAVGGLGFLVDGGVLTLLTAGGALDGFTARLISFPAALLATWLLNRRWTFAGRGGRRRDQEAMLYASVQLAGAGANYAAYAAVLLLVPALQAIPVAALVVGSAVGLAVNYAGAAKLVFPAAAGAGGCGPDRGAS